MKSDSNVIVFLVAVSECH